MRQHIALYKAGNQATTLRSRQALLLFTEKSSLTSNRKHWKRRNHPVPLILTATDARTWGAIWCSRFIYATAVGRRAHTVDTALRAVGHFFGPGKVYA